VILFTPTLLSLSASYNHQPSTDFISCTAAVFIQTNLKDSLGCVALNIIAIDNDLNHSVPDLHTNNTNTSIPMGSNDGVNGGGSNSNSFSVEKYHGGPGK